MKPLARLAMATVAWVVAFDAVVVVVQSGQATSVSGERWACPEEMHATFVQRFEDSPGFGFARMPTTLKLDRSGVLAHAGSSYAVDQVELVGWRLRQEPVVYVSRGHGPGPIMPNVATREPTQWEAESVEAVRAGRRIVCGTGEEASSLRCVGPLRAKPECLECHGDRMVGDVLGALSYRLRASSR